MAGGGGTRLWPLSTDQRPKQFLRLLSDKSLLRETYERVRPASEDVFVATAARYVDLVRQELPEIPEANASSPSRPAATRVRRCSAAALQFAEDGDPITAAIPSDQTVADGEAFRRALAQAAVARRSARRSSSSPSRRRVRRPTSGTSSSTEPGAGGGHGGPAFHREAGPAGGGGATFGPGTSGTPESSSSALRACSRRRAASPRVS